MELSIRLKTVAEAVTPGNRVADIGTDHGYVPIYLVKNNLSPGGIAMDVNKGPLEKAKEHIRAEKLSGKIATRLGNGLAPLEPGETDTVVIAGMGGDLICKILKAKPEFLIEGKELILQPQSEWFKVRQILKEYRYQIEKEWFLKEDGKYYVIIKAEPGWMQPQRMKHKQPSIHEYMKEIADIPENQTVAKAEMEEIYEQYGRYLIETKNSVLIEYLEKEIAKKEQIAADLKQSIKNMEDIEEIEELSGKDKANIVKRQRRYQELQKEIEPYVTRFYGVTPLRCEFLKKMYNIPSSKVSLLVMGVDDWGIPWENRNAIHMKIRNQLNIAPSDFLIITGGKIDERKNIHLLMEAVLNSFESNIHLVVFGNIAPEMKKKIDSLEDNEKIHYVGWLSSEKTIEYFFASDLAVFPGTHSVLWEQAVGIGIPSIFKYWDGMTHVDLGGNCLFLFENSSEEISKKISSLSSRETKYLEMKKIASCFAHKFYYSDIAKKVIEDV